MFIVGWPCLHSLLKTVTEQPLSGTSGFTAEEKPDTENIPEQSLNTSAPKEQASLSLRLTGKSKFTTFAEFSVVTNPLQAGTADILTDIATSHTHGNPQPRNHWFIINRGLSISKIIILKIFILILQLQNISTMENSTETNITKT